MQLGMLSYLLYFDFFSQKSRSRREIANESCVLLINYFFISLSDFVQGADARVFCGYYLVRLVSYMMLLNVL